MNEVEKITNPNAVAKLPLLAAVVAIGGLIDAIYLTIHHLTGEKVPCSVTGGCETVLTSSYAEIAGIPLATFGAIAYFIALVWLFWRPLEIAKCGCFSVCKFR